MMKRIMILLIVLLLASAAGCTKPAEQKPADPNAVFVDPNAVRGGEYGELYFASNGTRFGIYDETEAVLKALPQEIAEPYAEKSCAFDGEDVVHYFEGFEITCNEIDGVSRITSIRVTDDRVKTPQGLYILMPEADAAEAFPALKEADWRLIDGTAMLSVTIRDGVIREILYSIAIDGN
jgi:hypothetical protein